MSSDRIETIDGQTIDDLVALIKAREDAPNVDLIRRAYAFAMKAHEGQKRQSGEPYIVHPLATAITLAELGLDQNTVAAGLLHDVPEDTPTTLEEVQHEFGDEVGFLVEGITKLSQIKYRGVDRYVENLRRMFVATAEDARVILIKFADRINNLRTLQALPAEKRRRIALESLEIFAPIANRLGMGEIKGQLEDLSFPFVYPEEYQWMVNKIIPQFKAKEEYVDHFLTSLVAEMSAHNIEVMDAHGRTKHIYSLYQKLLKCNRDLNKIYDLVAIRVIVSSVAKCYEALGVIHEICKPLKGRIKDYIAQPKPNGYQSLHTTVFAPARFSANEHQVHIVEIQIRTPEMHKEAEFGIAAHWAYEELKHKKNIDHRIDWMQQIVDLQDTLQDKDQLLEALKIDLFQNRIYVFTPRGDVIELPEDATPVDYAYKIHTDMGHHCSGAKVNDQIVSLNTTLKNGDVIEIFTDPHRKNPSADWLEFVKTNTARAHIRSMVNRNSRSLVTRKFDIDE